MHELDELSDSAWATLAPHLAGKAGDVGRSGQDNRLFLNAVFWVARHGCAWRALPARFGKHDTVRKRSRRWAQKGVWARLFAAVQTPDLDWVLLDSTVVRTTPRRRAAEKSRVGDEALGRSRGRLSTKVHVLADAQGRPVHVVLGAGQQHDCTRAMELLQAVRKTGKVLADKAHDTNQVLAAVAALGAEAVIPSQPHRRAARPVDLVCYRQRNRIERLMGRLKQFRRLATRYDKTASSYLGFVHFGCALLWLR